MCGIIAVVRRRSDRAVPTRTELLELIAGVTDPIVEVELSAAESPLHDIGARLQEADRLLRGTPGLRALLADSGLADVVKAELGSLNEQLDRLESQLDAQATVDSLDLESVNSALISVRDAAWSIERDRLRAATVVADLGGRDVHGAGIDAIFSLHQALSGLDRMEVRGRDSAGLHLLISDHGLDLDDPAIASAIEARSGASELFTDSAVKRVGDRLSIVYKVAAEIGELGDNTASLRKSIREDDLLRKALDNDTAEVVVLGHTRWASVGIISEPNAHPVNSDLADDTSRPYCTAVLNGDVDNYGDLIRAEDLCIADDITTDTKVIPTLTSKHLEEGHSITEAFRRSVSVFEGSVAIGLSSVEAPNDLLLALRGSGQSIYVGLAEDSYIVASEPYGVVEETRRYIRMDGETPANPDNPSASRGQILRLDGALGGELAGIERVGYDGTTLDVSDDDVAIAEVTTRDIDRGDYPHYLLKEISEAPRSFRKTLRGRLIETDGKLGVTLGEASIPTHIADKLRNQEIRDIYVIGQGTAAVAGQAVAEAMRGELDGHLHAEAIAATELSGFGLRKDMSDVLVVAISQSGTTTDTNRTVDIVKQRGASVLAIVNRRGSDLTDRAEGVIYTSDGRDVEMSVASTKAFYAQIAAGFLLAVAIADLAMPDRTEEPADRQELLASLRDLPDLMTKTIEKRPDIERAASTHAPQRRYWACVGNGPNLVAARELRIKLSELCYKSIAADSTEDKKHIDLSSEPLILICAAGLVGSTADDVGKEVEIFRAHKSAPIVIANEGESRFSAALDAIFVPVTHPRLAFVLSTVVGHLLGYEAALAIDAQDRPLREARAAIEGLIEETRNSLTGEEFLARLEPSLAPAASQFMDGLRVGSYNGHLEASTAVQLASRLRFALGTVPLDIYQVEFGKVGTPAVVIEDLNSSLGTAIDELTRPVDAIKHQAKTVTVGISRTDETLLEVPLVASVLETGTPRDSLTYGTIRTLANLDPAVVEVIGWTRYDIDNAGSGSATINVIDRGGIAATIPSRTGKSPALKGTKKRVAEEREVLVAKGRSDGRPIMMIPEVKDNVTTGMTLLHLELEDHLEPEIMRGVLQGYRNRFSALDGAVTETEDTFRIDQLGQQDVGELLWVSIQELADRWRS